MQEKTGKLTPGPPNTIPEASDTGQEHSRTPKAAPSSPRGPQDASRRSQRAPQGGPRGANL
eukprot:8065302-Pyramimonas_sp.AAC.1